VTKFHKLKIKDIYKETEDCSVISFSIPEVLRETFSFKQGQYLTLKTKINGEEIRRSYSLCTNPYEGEWNVAVKKIEGGKFSTFANDSLKTGDEIEVMPPDGKFYVEVDASKPKNYIAFTAGSGITPILSIIKTHLAQEPKSTFKLFYLNKDSNSIIFKTELEKLESSYGNRFEVFHFLTQEQTDSQLFNGRFTKEKLERITSDIIDLNKIDECFLCGPEEMIFLIKDEFSNRGLKQNNIHFELFEVSTKNEDDSDKEIDAFDNAEVTITIDDEEYSFEVPKGKTILEVAEENDADVPFACKGGVCCTCKAKVIEGSVEMIVNYGLDDDDLVNNLVLTCQSLPTSDKVVLDYDDVY